MSNTQQPQVQSLAQMQTETLRLLAEVNLANARLAKARTDREARFYARFPLFERHEWLLPMLITLASMGAGACLTFAVLMLFNH